MANPVLTDRRFDLVSAHQVTGATQGTMTKAGVLSATGVLFVFLLAGATAGWWKFSSLLSPTQGNMTSGTTTTLVIAAVVAFVVGLVAVFVPKLAKILGPIYAICEGFLIGAVSKAYDARFNGIVVMAVGATVAVALTVLMAFLATGLISRLLGKTGMMIVVRVLGLVLCAMAVQFIIVGLSGATVGFIRGSAVHPWQSQ